MSSRSDYWQFGDVYGPVGGSSFRGRRMTWDEYQEQSHYPGLSGCAFWVKVPDDEPSRVRQGVSWIVGYGYVGSIRDSTHTVIENDDGTISVDPSLVIDGKNGERWHGFLKGGIFTGAFER